MNNQTFLLKIKISYTYNKYNNMTLKDSKYSTVTIPRELYHNLRDYAKKYGYNISRWVSILIENEIKESK